MIGRLGADPELRYFPSGDAVCNFSMVHDVRWSDKETGEKKERPVWVRWVATKGQAELIAKYVKKGHQLYCEGLPDQRSYEKDGVTHYVSEVRVKEVELLSNKPDSKPEKSDSSAEDFDDDIPF
jgi:single-strand DNA-binding protein